MEGTMPKASGGTERPPGTTEPESAPVPRRRSGRRAFLILGLLALLAGGVFLFKSWLERNQEWTDDAQIEADIVPVSARVAGQVQEVLVVENQPVHAGEVIVRLDPTDFEVRLTAARAELAAASAAVNAAEAQIDVVEASTTGQLSSANAQLTGSTSAVDVAESQVRAARAELARAQAQADRAEADLERVRGLTERGIRPQADLDNAQTAYDVAQDTLSQAEAGLAIARNQRHVAEAGVDAATALVAQSEPIDAHMNAARAQVDLARAREQAAEAAVEQARLALAYTTVTAPADGFLSHLAVARGQYVQPGQTIVMLVPEHTYVEANFKETQIGRMQIGQRVEVTVDAYPGRTFLARVASLSAGTGSRFSLLPPDNASGNFIKVVQRVPVRLEWVDPPSDVALRPGLSVEVTVFLDGIESPAPSVEARGQ